MNKSFLVKAAALSAAVALSACGGKDTGEAVDWTVNEPVVEQVEEVIEEAAPAVEMVAQTVVYFGFDQSDISAETADVLAAHAEYLMAMPEASVVLEGHADDRGTPEYNLALGERRGSAAADFLRGLGVNADQISVVSMGEEMLADFGTSEESHALNRRVEIKY